MTAHELTPLAGVAGPALVHHLPTGAVDDFAHRVELASEASNDGDSYAVVDYYAVALATVLVPLVMFVVALLLA
ncbi:hypothetical protein [Nocardioides ferulae]|uniref:hypothetical protein n=1 Tax=Nocardioides ferulae TaxID=2340821 RepID=UPI000F86D89D|nr:hypothetical protein [Nocardioides ferulae]